MKKLYPILFIGLLFSFAPTASAAPLKVLDSGACNVLGISKCKQTQVCAANPDTGNPGCFSYEQANNYIRYNVPYPDAATCGQQSNCQYACTLKPIENTYFCSEISPCTVPGNSCTTSSGTYGICTTDRVCASSARGATTGGSGPAIPVVGTGVPGGNNIPVVGTGPSNNPGQPIYLENPLGAAGTNINTFLNSILDLVIQIGTVVVVFMLIYVGFLFVVARGEPGKITEARHALLWTIIGALILLGAKAIAIGIEETVKALSVGK